MNTVRPDYSSETVRQAANNLGCISSEDTAVIEISLVYASIDQTQPYTTAEEYKLYGSVY